MVNFKTQNSVQDMVEVLKVYGPMTENQINTKAFGYTRGASFGSNKKYADMLRRGLVKGIIDRVELPKNKSTRSTFMYFVPSEIKIPCSAALDNEWANESI
jgi:hypothetical protein